MRAPFQVLALLYQWIDGKPCYYVLHRADHDQWQFISGGGEDDETPLEAVRRETWEEGGVDLSAWLPLTSISYIPTNIFHPMRRSRWPLDLYVLPEHCFGCECNAPLTLSQEHIEYRLLPYTEAYALLKWDSNRTALYELDCRLRQVDARI